MRPLLLKTVLFMLIFSLHARADRLLAVTTNQKAEIRAEYVPLGLETEYIQAARQLLSFLETSLYPALPSQVRKAIAGRKILITLKKDPGDDGVFIDDEGPDFSISIRHSELRTENARQILAHEFFHAVHHALRPGEPAWIREGLAQLFEFRVLGYFNELNMKAAFADFSTPLEGTYVVGKTSRAQYGHDLMYFYYLWANCGRDRLFWRIASSGLETAFNEVASHFDLEQCRGFEKSAVHFEIARAQNEFDGTANSNEQIHFLWPTTLPASQPRSVLSANEINLLNRFQPVTLTADTVLPPRMSKEVQLYWLQKSFPYAVTTITPKNGHWTLLLLKL